MDWLRAADAWTAIGSLQEQKDEAEFVTFSVGTISG
jgi:hypothetical protein